MVIVFIYVQSREEHEGLVNGVLEAKRLRKKIDQVWNKLMDLNYIPL